MGTKAKPQRPELGARVKASGYMVQYKSDASEHRSSNDSGVAHGWKRKNEPVEGVFFGVRYLQIIYWRHEYIGDEDYYPTNIVGRIRVYAIAISPYVVRYVLPRDVEVIDV